LDLSILFDLIEMSYGEPGRYEEGEEKREGEKHEGRIKQWEEENV
jgi:hypothetical protein